MQAKNYPFYTTQFHAEENLFNTQVDEERGTFQAVEIAQQLVLAFVQKCKLSQNTFKSNEDLYNALIYNYPLTKYDQASREKQEYLFDR